MREAIAPPISQIHILWQALADELAGIFDAHFVCATLANKAAVQGGVTAVVGLRSQVSGYVDVWVATPDGRLSQTRWSEDKSSMAPFMEAGTAVSQTREELSPAELIQSELWHLADDEIVAVPFPFRPTPTDITPRGALCLLDPAEDCFITRENIGPLANFVTTYIDRAFFNQRTVQQDIEFQVVSEINYALAATLSLERIFIQLSDPVRRILNVESVSLGLIEPGGEIAFVTSLMGPLFQDLPPIRLKVGQGIAGWVASHAQPVIVNNVYDDKRFYAKADNLSGFQTHSMVCVPLKVEQRVIGVLQAINKQVGEFNEHDLRLLQAISGPLAAAIANASLHGDVLAEKQRIQTIFSSMSEGMVTVDANGRITAVNDSLSALLRRSAAELEHQSADEAIRLRKGRLGDFLAEVMLMGEDEHHQLAGEIVIGPEEFAPVLMSGAPIPPEEGEPAEAIIIFSDLSQIREVERMRDDFFHNIVHELRTPLATILMYARLLRDGKTAEDAAKTDRFLGVIERESDRLQSMVRQTLQLAKLGAREIQRSSELVDLNDLFDEITPPLADQAIEKGLSFSQRINYLPPVNGNRETLYVIFKNLLENAVKFTLSGTVRITARVEDGQVRVDVQDEGIGIPEAAMPNLFKRFYRAQTAVERGIAGTGLGLFMVKDGVEKHQGMLDVHSVEGEGTTFTVCLPVANGA